MLATATAAVRAMLASARHGWLRMLVQVDAFRSDPATYLGGLGWRMLGLRLRARNQIAPLAGRSRHAYRLWMAVTEPMLKNAIDDGLTDERASILVVIDCRGDLDGLADTLASIRRSDRHAAVALLGADTRLAGIILESSPDIVIYADLTGLAGRLGEHETAWICPLAPGDQLAPGALATYARAAGAATANIVYTDDDLLDSRQRRSEPHFKPDWNAELFHHHDFVSGAAILRVTRGDLLAITREDWVGAIVSRLVEGGGSQPRHLPLALHHRRKRPQPVRPARLHATASAQPLVTVVIPTRNHVALLRECLAGLRRTEYHRLECIVIDNDSDDPAARSYLAGLADQGIRVLPYPGPFNYAAMNNAAAAIAQGDLLCFLNNDIEMLDAGWLSIMIEQACRREVGAVGAKLLYPDRTIQHAGVVLGVGGGAAHAHRYCRDADAGYFARPHLPQFVTAVTAACLVISRAKFFAVGGFDAVNFPVAFNDVDLCLKLNARGWQSFYEPRATLIHHESKSRGSDRAKANRGRFAGELEALKRIWFTDRATDPYHHVHLSPFSEQFVVAV